jgi:cytochrome b6-f complex iron-sulfur subunit
VPPVNLFTFITANLSTDLLTIGSFMQNTTQGAFVERIASGNTPAAFRALSLRCTHSGCTIAHQASLQEFHCPCHGSKFLQNGQLLQGPAPRNLEMFEVRISGNILTVVG